jgi:hypothetical protein
MGVRIINLRRILPNLDMLYRYARKKLEQPQNGADTEERSQNDSKAESPSMSAGVSPSLIQRALSRLRFSNSASVPIVQNDEMDSSDDVTSKELNT